MQCYIYTSHYIQQSWTNFLLNFLFYLINVIVHYNNNEICLIISSHSYALVLIFLYYYNSLSILLPIFQFFVSLFLSLFLCVSYLLGNGVVGGTGFQTGDEQFSTPKHHVSSE